MPAPGEIWRHDRYYLDSATGAWKTKYLLVMAVRGGNVVHRLLTSRRNSRPYHPPCFHDDPYPGFYLGVLGDPLTQESWLDLRELEDLDAAYFVNKQQSGQMEIVGQLAHPLLCEAILCTANAQDTTRQQNASLFVARGLLNCR